jgi:sodium/bile acid cotransporter 7
LVLTVAIAAVLPCRGGFARVFDAVTTAAIALLFFLHGAKLSREAIVAGASHWRLHALVFTGTFVLFPILGLLSKPLGTALLTPQLSLGVMFLCVLPSTVQSSIAFTSIAGGNVPAAICSASASNVFAVFLTPMLVSLLVSGRDMDSSISGSFGAIALQILVPFVAVTWLGLGSADGCNAANASPAASIGDQFCLSFTPPSAKRSWKVYGRVP